MGKLIRQRDVEIRRIDLLHPTQHAPAVATQVGFYMSPTNGRMIGLKLAFAGGHVAELTFEEIRDLQAGLSNFNSE